MTNRIHSHLSMLVLLVSMTAVFVVTGSAQGPTSDEYAASDNALMRDAQHYASDYGVSLAEAMSRLQLQEEIRVLNNRLQGDFPETFAGLWVQHAPLYRVHLSFTEYDEKKLEEYLLSTSLNGVEVTKAKLSLHELRSLQSALQHTVNQLGISADFDINLPENQVELYTTNTNTTMATIRQAGVQLSEHTKLIQVEQLSQVATDIFAGLSTLPCTGGPTVLHNDDGATGTLGITTAGHCSCAQPTQPCQGFTPITYNGVELPLQARTWSGSYDVEWHTLAGFTARNLMFDGANNRYVFGIRPHANQYVGEYVCKYGRMTGAGCGHITSLFFDGDYIRVHSDTTDLCEPGDSGGPWFGGNIAYGLMSGHLEPGNDAYYMAADYVSILSLCILHGPLNPVAPNLSATRNNGVSLSWTRYDDVCGYEVHRSQSPYFSPNEATLVVRVVQNAGFSSYVGVGDPNNNYFYVVRSLTGSDSPASNTVGEFDFALVPGS
ncbi:MAG: hypothetical protein CVU38_16635 [Chloroflexi bacterium HGW-Chloroflexi-1]|nr:MAG: hypothetical protein CVU38_16635 [Chloroflexi bacterium HGW-Chloroflexi-1]